MAQLKKFLSTNAVVLIAVILAAVSMCIVKPDGAYADYFDWRTLCCLFSTMLVVGACKNIKLFSITADTLIKKLKDARKLYAALVFITFVSSIFIANDMALLTFLPLTFLVFKNDGNYKRVIFTVTMQTVAANLGGMIMPFGNPQSLYLYSYFNISVKEFFEIMVIPFCVSAVLIALTCFIVKKGEVTGADKDVPKLDKKRTVLYAALGIVAVLAVFRVINYIAALCIVAGVLLIVDRRAFLLVDYGLLLTFFAFFIFANNMARIPAVDTFVESLLNKNTLLTAVLSSQIISNVPTSIFLSKFTTDYKHLLLAVNIGGCGTLVASLASLISFKNFNAAYPGHTAKYLWIFSSTNFCFLGISVAVCLLI